MRRTERPRDRVKLIVKEESDGNYRYSRTRSLYSRANNRRDIDASPGAEIDVPQVGPTIFRKEVLTPITEAKAADLHAHDFLPEKVISDRLTRA
jgi:hypothetical protein